MLPYRNIREKKPAHFDISHFDRATLKNSDPAEVARSKGKKREDVS
jgi:hypothetical protein